MPKDATLESVALLAECGLYTVVSITSNFHYSFNPSGNGSRRGFSVRFHANKKQPRRHPKFPCDFDISYKSLNVT